MIDGSPAQAHLGRELYVRHARLDGRSVCSLRVVDEGDRCIVQADVWPTDTHTYDAVQAGPYAFASAVEATRFVTHAVESLIALGCDVKAE